MYTVYMHELKNDGRMYIGQTVNIAERWACRGAKYKACRHFWNAIKKYGWDAFNHIALYSGLSKQEADALEMLLISKHDSSDPRKGFNLRGGGQRGTVSEETRRKMSEAIRGEKHPNYGKRLPETHRRHISEANKGEKNGFYGRRHTEETRAIIKEKRAQQVCPRKGKKHTAKAKAAMRDAKREQIKTVLCIETGSRFDGLKEAGRETGIDRSSISRCCRGMQKSAGGFHWRFA